MPNFACTPHQLYQQLLQQGYQQQDCELIHQIYWATLPFISANFLPSGNPFCIHGIRTASILAWCRCPIHVVAAGLIHNLYGVGDFTYCLPKYKIRTLKRLIPSDVEELVFNFGQMPWRSDQIELYSRQMDQLTPMKKNVIRMRLADHLEHFLDCGILYRSCAENFLLLNQQVTTMAALATALGHDQLAVVLPEVCMKTMNDKIIDSLRHSQQWSSIIKPSSYRKRISSRLLELAQQGLRRARRVPRKCRTVFNTLLRS